MDEPDQKKQKVTTFKLTEGLTAALDAIAQRDGCSKDAAIRRMIALGIQTDDEIQALHRQARHAIAKQVSRARKPDAPPLVRRSQRAS